PPPFAGIALSMVDLARTSAARAKLDALLRTPASPAGSAYPLSHPATLEFKNLSCAYGNRPPAIEDLTLRWTCSRPLVLVVHNVPGKSSLLRLLVDLLKPTAGTIHVGSPPHSLARGAGGEFHDLTDLDPTLWRQRVAYLPQRPYLPAQSTVANAIRFLEPDATDSAIADALTRVDLLATLDEKSPGKPLEAIVDALSSGERQRLALARALVRQADIYLLDEPDQNLDRKGLAIVAAIVRDLGSKAAVVIAAHDPEMLPIEGHHVELRHGRIVEERITDPASGDKPVAQASGYGLDRTHSPT